MRSNAYREDEGLLVNGSDLLADQRGVADG
jgi:hypothetical protein